MPQQPQRPDKPSWLSLPTMLSEDEEIRGYFQRKINHNSPRRRWMTQRAAENLWFYLGRQWIEARGQLTPGQGTYHFDEVYRSSTAAFPRPVTNMIAPAVDNEVSRLARKEYVPDTSAAKNEPEYMAAARLAKDILMFEMSKQIWDDKREALIFNLVVESVAICRTVWDENELETTLIQSPDAATCPGCKRKFASSVVPASFAALGMPLAQGGHVAPMLWPESAEEMPLSGEMTSAQAVQRAVLKMRRCPFCEQPTDLQPYAMNESEAGGMDVFGRPMGLMVPRGEGMLEVLSVHEYFPENGGVGVEPSEQRVCSQEKVRSLEWIAIHFPEFEKTLEKEAPAELLRTSPLYGEPSLSGVGVNAGVGSGYETYDNHARVQEVVVAPLPLAGLDKGAHFIRVNDKVAKRELCYETEGDDGPKLVPRIKYHFARFKRIPSTFDGRTFVDDLKPLNRRLNEIDAQSIDLRERGKPNMWCPAGTEIYTRDDENLGALTVFEFDSAMSGWKPQDGIFPGIPLTGAVYAQERAQILSDMKAIGFPQDIEMGAPVGSVKTTSGLMLISEEASQKRAPRERALVNLYQSAFTHLLDLNWAFRKEDQTYEIMKEGGLFERKSFTGTDLVGGLRVKMDARAGYDVTLYNKEAAAEALQMGLYKLDSPAAVDRILDLMRLPKDVNENQTLQIQRAEMAWSDFMRKGLVPPIDAIYDPGTWYSVLGKRWFTDEAYIKQERAGWQALVPRIVLWKQKMAEMEAAEAPAKQIYGNIPQAQWPAIQAQGEALVKDAWDKYNKAQQAFDVMQQVPPPAPVGSGAGSVPPPQAPQPPPMQQFPVPPPGGFLPDPLEEKIYTVWRRMLPDLEAGLVAAVTAKELASTTPAGAGAIEGVEQSEKLLELEGLMRMRAVIEAFRMMVEGSIPPGAPPPPPPGGPGGPPGGPAGGPPPPPGR